MQFRLRYLGIIAFFFLLGCSSERENSGKKKSQTASIPEFSSVKTEDVFVYNCADSLQFTAYVKKDSAWLFLPDTSLKVMPIRSGSGAKYAGSDYLYWSKGDEALFQMPTGSLMNCKSIPQERSWQAAKIRGVNFRALGQEPGWYLELTKGRQIVYVGNYGKNTVRTPVPTPEKTDTLRVYNVETETHTLRLEITDQPCTDSMSGFKFPATVSVTVDGKTYRGCGKYLSQEPYSL